MGATLSILASVAILRSTINQFVPPEVRSYLWSLTLRYSSGLSMVIEESHKGSANHLFSAAVTYLGAHVLSSSSSSSSLASSYSSAYPQKLTAGKNENIRTLTFGLGKNSEIVDIFHGVQVKWKYFADYNDTQQLETRRYELCFRKEQVEMIKNKYLPHVLDVAKRLEDQNRVVKFHTVRRDRWSSSAVNLEHPMSFDALAMDGDLKEEVIEDLDSFITSKGYYKKIGKVWKRGYLLYGPPGTGKSSLIAAMANHLNFDIYNLNLSAVTSDTILENLLLHVSNRSILVVEDIDCSVTLQNREDGEKPDNFPRLQVSLSGLLNATDGLLSCCGEERITVFTTNYKDRIDPALLRPGRMDMHICMSYCTFSIFKQLAVNYLGVSDHHLFSSIEKLIGKVTVSPAEVAGELMRTRDCKSCLQTLIGYLESKVSEVSASPLLVSNIDEKMTKQMTEEKCGKSLNNNSEKHLDGQLSDTSTDIVNGDLLANHEDKLPKLDYAPNMVIGRYTVKEEMKHILNAIGSKYGDIVANCTLHSLQCRSSFLEIVCSTIHILQETSFEKLTESVVESMITDIRDLESVKLEVGWFRKRLDEIAEAVQLVEQCSTLKEERKEKIHDIKKLEKELETFNTETSDIQSKAVTLQEKLVELKNMSMNLSQSISSTEAKVSRFLSRSLLDGLL